MTYAEAVAYLNGLVNYESSRQPETMQAITLDRMHTLCRRLGDPQRSFRSILIAGTNGKGSIAAMLYSVLRASTLRAGLYTSPHLEHLRERIRVAPCSADHPQSHVDDWIAEEEFVAMAEQLRPAVEAMRRTRSSGAPTYFEAMTAIAFLHFRQRRVDVAVLEVGLGGRLDATNVVTQAVSVFAPIDLDHTEILGEERSAIAQEKAAIIKPSQMAVTAFQHEEVTQVLRARCAAQGVPLVTYGEQLTAVVHEQTLEGLQVSLRTPRGAYDEVTIPLLGRHQAQNAAVAVAALEALSEMGIPYAMVEQGLSRVEWPGRLEVVHERPLVIFDGAHNPHAARAVQVTLEELCGDRRVHVLIGMSSDKSVEGVAEVLGSPSRTATCTQSRHPRAMDPTLLAKRLRPWFADVHVMSDAADAYTYLLNAVPRTDVIVVTGSLFFVGELRAALRKAHIRSRRYARRQPVPA